MAVMRLLALGEMLRMQESVNNGGPLLTGWGGDTLATLAAMAALLGSAPKKNQFSLQYYSGFGAEGDASSDEAIAYVRKAGIGTSFVARIPNRTVGSFTLLRNDRGDLVPDPLTGDRWRFDRFSSAATQAFSEKELGRVRHRLLNETDVIFLSTISVAVTIARNTGANTGDMERLFQFLDAAYKRGIEICLSTNLRPALWGFSPDSSLEDPGKERARRALEHVLSISTIVFASKSDADSLYGESSSEEHCRRFRSHGVRNILLTNAEKDVLTCDSKGRVKRHRTPLIPESARAPGANDAGCGDAFAAGALSALLYGADIETACTLGQRVGGEAYKSPKAILEHADLQDILAISKNNTKRKRLEKLKYVKPLSQKIVVKKSSRDKRALVEPEFVLEIAAEQ